MSDAIKTAARTREQIAQATYESWTRGGKWEDANPAMREAYLRGADHILPIVDAVVRERDAELRHQIEALYDKPPREGAYRVDDTWFHGTGADRICLVSDGPTKSDVLALLGESGGEA